VIFVPGESFERVAGGEEETGDRKQESGERLFSRLACRGVEYAFDMA
jgi:hypothetical protein